MKKVSGINYLDFLRPRFLEPLGIYCTVEQTQRGELEGSRTMCTAEGFAKLSLFYLQEGNWNGQQLLDARLVRAAVSFQVPTRRCSSISFMHSDQLAGYGFQLWRNAREGAAWTAAAVSSVFCSRTRKWPSSATPLRRTAV